MMNTVRKSENLLPFPVISAAANGDTTAMCAILKHYHNRENSQGILQVEKDPEERRSGSWDGFTGCGPTQSPRFSAR